MGSEMCIRDSINTEVAALADTVTEVVVGIPVPVKERKEAGYAHH